MFKTISLHCAILVLIFIGAHSVCSQPQGPDTLWTKHFDGIQSAKSVLCESDGSIMVSGTILLDDTIHLYVMKLNSNGDSLWLRRFGRAGVRENAGGSLCRTSDGGYLLAGEGPFGFPSSDIYLASINRNGDLLWERLCGTYNSDNANTIVPTWDGGFIIGGNVGSYPLAIRIDSNGDTLWTRDYIQFIGKINSIVQSSDGGFIAVGEKWIMDSNQQPIFILRLDSLGNLLDEQVIGETNWMHGEHIVATSDSGWLITGIIDTIGISASVFLLKESANGDTQWTQIYRTGSADRGREAISWPDNSYTVLSIYGLTPDFWGLQLTRLNGYGQILWQRLYETSDDWFRWGAIAIDNAGSYVMAGQRSIISMPQLTMIKTMPDLTSSQISDRGEYPFIGKSIQLSAYPNPFNSSTTISFSLSRASEVKLSVYDVLGRNVGKQPFASSKIYSAGEHRIEFDGAGLSSGIYFVRMEAGGNVQTRKMMLLK
jgi:hypothetical protein